MMKFYKRVSHSRRVIVNFVCTGHGRRLNARLKRAERINTERKERGREIEEGGKRKRDKSQEGKRDKEGQRVRAEERPREKANEKRTVYLATGCTYRSICAQPLNTQTAYVGIHRFQFLLLCLLFFLRARRRRRRRGRRKRGGGGWWLPVDCTLRTALCAYTGSLICASTSG